SGTVHLYLQHFDWRRDGRNTSPSSVHYVSRSSNERHQTGTGRGQLYLKTFDWRDVDRNISPPVHYASLPSNEKHQTDKESAWRPRKVILFAYHRSGSSFTADIIHHSSDVYYIFEPLRAFANKWFLTRDSEIQIANDYLNKLLTCNLSSPYLRMIPKRFLLRTHETPMITQCYDSKLIGSPPRMMKNRLNIGRSDNHHNKNDNGMFDGDLRKQCLEKAEAVCRRHSVRMVKVIRYNMKAVREIMTLNPELGVIYLVRDPRASLWSRMTLFKDPTSSDLKSFAPELCRAMLNHSDKARDIFNEDPHRLRFLRYEDLADEPVKVLQNIFQFLHLNWTDSTERQVVKQTQHSVVNMTESTQKTLKRKYSVVRADSSAAASSWRRDVPWYVVDTIQRSAACRKVMDLLGYKMLDDDDEVRNLSVPSRGKFTLQDTLNYGGGDLGV
ncbi:hypothetical protein BaRGS_00009324, partial [Batillaria attramentaria]